MSRSASQVEDKLAFARHIAAILCRTQFVRPDSGEKSGLQVTGQTSQRRRYDHHQPNRQVERSNRSTNTSRCATMAGFGRSPTPADLDGTISELATRRSEFASILHTLRHRRLNAGAQHAGRGPASDRAFAQIEEKVRADVLLRNPRREGGLLPQGWRDEGAGRRRQRPLPGSSPRCSASGRRECVLPAYPAASLQCSRRRSLGEWSICGTRQGSCQMLGTRSMARTIADLVVSFSSSAVSSFNAVAARSGSGPGTEILRGDFLALISRRYWFTSSESTVCRLPSSSRY